MSQNSRRFPFRYWIFLSIGALLLAVIVWLISEWALPVIKPPDETPTGVVTVVDDTLVTAEDGETTFTIRLSDGEAQPQDVVPVPLATGEPLSDQEITAILARLPDLQVDPGDQVDFKLAFDPIPPPRTGDTIPHSFPPPDAAAPEPVVTGPLEVLRYAPEGEIPIAPFLNVTFNQPMVPLGTLSQLSAIDVPVQIEPELPGIWKWIGTKTLVFEYDSDLIDRLPMATEFVVTIPAGTKSATGNTLASAVSWKFSTPPPSLIRSSPHSLEPQPLEPVFFMAFDQRIEPDAVMGKITATADGKEFNIKMATDDEIKDDDRLKYLVENAGEGRWMAFVAEYPLPADSGINVRIEAGMPSAEGPLVTTATQSFSFRTYAPLKVEDHGCSWHSDECYPLSPLYIEFNNPIDLDKFDDSMLSIDPALPGVSFTVYGDTITIRGPTQGRTTYRVTVDSSITDIFGQQLGRDTKLTFKIGKAEPTLIGPQNRFVTLDPSATTPALSLYSINYTKLYVKVYAVEPSDWPQFKTYLKEYYRTDQHPDPPGKLILSETMRLDTPVDTLSEVNVDLRKIMDGNFGQFIVTVKPPTSILEKERYWEHVQVWVQVTQIGLDAFADHSEMIAWTTTLQDGVPLEGVSIQSDKGDLNTTTGKDGIARFSLPSSGIQYLIAQRGADRAMLPRSENVWGNDSWYPRSPNDNLRWYVFDDRAMYRPGEEVHIKGWMRRVGGKQDGDVGLVGSNVTQVSYQLIGPQGNEMNKGEAEVNALGGFDFAFTLPEKTNLGYAQLNITASGSLGGLNGRQYTHGLQIQEFRRPEFEVTARNETTGPYFAGGKAITAVKAEYYAGGPLPNAEVNWHVNSSPTNYKPPNWPDFSFGTWTPWWWWRSDSTTGSVYESFSGETDATGNHYLHMEFGISGEPKTYSVVAEASVMDVNRQAWAASTSLMVHPADLYVGLRSERYFVERGDPLEIDLIVTDLDGNPVADRPIKVTASRMEWKYQQGEWRRVPVDVQECTVGSKTEPVSCTFKTPMGGRYQITASITDELGRGNQSQFTRWVTGSQQPPSRKVEKEEATLIPDKETYQPGDIAEILVQSPFSPAEGLLTVSRSGILYTERFIIEDGTIVLRVPIKEAHIPNLHVQVDLVGAAPRTDDQGEVIKDIPPRPAYASNRLNLSIPPLERTLSVEVTPRDTEMEPGGETTIDVRLKDATGESVSDAALAVVVVDEAVLALTNYQLTDPVSIFYYTRSSDVSSKYGRASIILVDPQSLAAEAQAALPTQTAAMRGDVLKSGAEGALELAAPAAAEPEEMMMADAAAGMGGEAGPTPIAVRTDFNPLAIFAPSVRTDASGKAAVEVKLPDNLTRYRVMVVAVDEGGSQFGSAESSLTARLPLMVRPSASRFLNFGDQFELPVVLQNQTDNSMVVDVVAEATNIELTDAAGLRVTVPSRNRIEVRFPGTTVSAGTANFRFAAVSGKAADAALVSLPVYTPATTEAFATYGVVDSGAVIQPVASPQDVFPQYGGLEITTSSTALQALTDAVLYLVAYPFECSEQLASRVLAVSALRDVLTAFDAAGLPSPEAMEAAVVRDIAELKKLQNYNGGFPYWRRGRDSIPFNTVHVAHALQRARMMGFDVPESIWGSVLNYLRDIENHYPYWYSVRLRRTISSYALFVRHYMGDSDPQKTSALFDEAGIDGLSLEALAWLWHVFADTSGYEAELDVIRRHVNNRAVETAGAANFTTSYDDDAYLLLHSNRRTDALLLDALIVDNPQSDLIPKVVNGLLAHRKKGRWYNTQENVFVLLALDRYFDIFEAREPDFVARIWLGDTYAGSSTFSGYSTERHQIDIPMAYLIDTIGAKDQEDLIVSKDGVGRLYYRLGLRYTPTSLKLDPVEMGFVIQRVYEAVDDPDDVTLDSDGVWHIKAGARVRVRVTMVADNRRYHVALVDPLPAGLEIINPALAVSESVPQDPNSTDYKNWWWWWPWYDHQNMRDERVEAFTPLLWDGVYEYTYVARATMPGTFVVPPAKAEEMYSPEVFGRSGSDFVIVE